MRSSALGRRIRIAALLCSLPLASAAPSAQAQTTDATAAQALFEQARALFAQGRYAEACPKFEESQRLDPGSGTLINLARCYEQIGRHASAWNKYLEAAAAANATGNTRREKEARERAETLRPSLSTLVVDVSAEGKQVPGLEVRRDGSSVGAPQWGVPIPADVGEHTIVATAPGHDEWRRVVTVEGPAKSVSVEVPALTPSSAAGPSATTAVEVVPEPELTPRRGLGTQRVLALIAGGVGVAGIGVGSVFGLKSKSKHDEAEKYCDGADCTDPRGVSAGEDAYSAGTLSTVFMVVGGAALAGGAVLWFTAPKREEQPIATVGIGPGSVQVRGAF